MTSSNVRCEYGYGRVEGHCFRALSRAKHDQGNDQDDDEFANAKHDLADLRRVRYEIGTGSYGKHGVEELRSGVRESRLREIRRQLWGGRPSGDERRHVTKHAPDSARGAWRPGRRSPGRLRR